MQPPDITGAGCGRPTNSCYDPKREERENYTDLAMPSTALTAAIEGNLLDDKENREYLS